MSCLWVACAERSAIHRHSIAITSVWPIHAGISIATPTAALEIKIWFISQLRMAFSTEACAVAKKIQCSAYHAVAKSHAKSISKTAATPLTGSWWWRGCLLNLRNNTLFHIVWSWKSHSDAGDGQQNLLTKTRMKMQYFGKFRQGNLPECTSC